MTASVPLSFPDASQFEGWWQQLAHFQPGSIAIARLMLQQVDCLTAQRKLSQLSRTMTAILQAVDRMSAVTLDILERAIPLPRQHLRLLLDDATAAGLLLSISGASWCITPLGLEAVRRREYVRLETRREVFTFLESPIDASPLRIEPKGAIPVCKVPFDEQGRRFDLTEIRPLIGGYELLDLDSSLAVPSSGNLEDWRKVAVITRLSLVAVILGGPQAATTGLLAFPLIPDTWTLAFREPSFALPAHLLPQVPVDAWYTSWQAWCANEMIPPEEAALARLERSATTLDVSLPETLLQKWRQHDPHRLTKPVWLRVNTGPIQQAVRVDFRGA